MNSDMHKEKLDIKQTTYKKIFLTCSHFHDRQIFFTLYHSNTKIISMKWKVMEELVSNYNIKYQKYLYIILNNGKKYILLIVTRFWKNCLN